MSKQNMKLKLRKVVAAFLVIVILLSTSTSTLMVFAEEGNLKQNTLNNENSIVENEMDNNNSKESENNSGKEEIKQNVLNNDANEELGENSSVEETNNEIVTPKSVKSRVIIQNTASQETTGEGFKVNLRWGGTSNTTYTWNATEKENRVIKLTFYYQNEVTSKNYNAGDLKVTIPGIGKLNRDSCIKATDIAADEYGTTQFTRDWSYKYNTSADTYTFYNNKAIERGESFSGSFELLWQFESRECVNGYNQKLQATLDDGEKSVLSQELTLEYTSKKDTFYINKTAIGLVSADGLSRFVENGKTVGDYAWVQYNFKYNVEELNARGLKNRYLIDTFPAGCIIARDSDVFRNEDGTVSYKVQENQLSEYNYRESSIIVGYPQEYVGTTVKNIVYLNGTYKDRKEEELLATSEAEIKLINTGFNFGGYIITTGKSMSPSYIYRNELNSDVKFSATLRTTTSVKPIDQSEYSIALTDDLLEIYTDDYHRLTDDEYKFTSVTVPGRGSINNVNGYAINDGNYTVKIKALYKENVNTRNLNEYTTVYEGTWQNSSITQNLEGNVVAIRVEIGGLTESVKGFYINTSGKINISESNYENPSYIINYSFTDFYDNSGNYLTENITENNYSRQSLYNQDVEIYGKGLQRASDIISIRESEPGYYYARAEIDKFGTDKEIENFTTTQTHSIQVYNTNAKEITKIEIHGVQESEELETLIETLKFTYSGLSFKYKLSDDVLSNDENMQDYLRERASIEKNGKEITVTFNFEDNPIVSKNFAIGYSVDSNLSYENYYEATNPTYRVTTYALIEDEDLNPQSTRTYNSKTMAYETNSTSIILALASHQQLIKLIKTEYTNGEFVEDGAVVPLNTEYIYRLKLRNGYNTLDGTEFIDILEHAELTNVDGEYPYEASEWYGKLKSVDTKYLENKGHTVRVYYANTTAPDNNSWTQMETHLDGIWQTVNEVKAIKVEIDGEIEENSIVHVDINMQAPTDKTLVDKYAYNTYKVNADAIDVYTGLKSSYLRNMPSNNTEVRLIEKEYNVEISKVDAESGSKLQGVSFGIYDEQGNKIRGITTGILGNTIIKELKDGTYTIKEEVVPLGYEKPEDYTLIIENGNYTLKQGETTIEEGTAELEGTIPSIKITIENNRAKGSIKVYKIDEYLDENKQEIPLQGVEFELQDTEGTVLYTGTTNENGEILFENLAWGKTYIVKETKTLDAYELAPSKNPYLSRLIKDKVVKVENKRKTGKATLTKEDEIDENINLDGATYGLFAENDIYNKNGEVEYEKDSLILEKTTNEDGQVTFENLIWGDYYIKETKTVYGYELSEEKYVFTVNAENVENVIQKTEKEERSKAKLELIKIDSTGGFLQGAEFTLFNENGELVKREENPVIGITDENGQLNIENIEWGTYYIQETKAPQGYEQNDTKYEFTVNRETFLDDNKVIAVVTNIETNEEISIIKNDKKKGKVVLTKYKCNASGEETEEILPGAVFELYLSDGTKVGEYTSNEEGKIVAENLDWGSYYFQEKEAPEGYSISNKKISFVINSRNVDFEQELTAYNKQESGEIKINKTIKANSLVESHGNASFLFKIVGKDGEEEKVTLYRTVTFTGNDTPDEQGNITKTIVISDLERYKYEITEEENYRYELDSITPVTNNSQVSGEIGIIDLTIDNKGEITFVNKKTNNSLLTDAKLITNTTQSGYYLIGISAEPKEESYAVGTELTASDFTYTLYYSGGQEVQIDLTEGITFDGESTYTQATVGDYIANIEYTINGKTFETETPTKWVLPSDYFTYTVNSDNTITITGVNSRYPSPTVLYIPSEYNGYEVNVITGKSNYECMSNISNVKNVVIEDGVKYISNGTFSRCSSLASIELPDSVTSIGSSAFYDCSSLTSIIIPTGVTSIGNSTFLGCTSLNNIQIPNSVASIGSLAFQSCRSLTTIEIPASVTSIGNYAFYGCSSLTSIIIPTGVTSIGNSTFYNCTSLNNIQIPNSVASIGSSAFQSCRSLTTIEIPASVTSIGNYAFSFCESLKSIEIPDRVVSIENNAFEFCSSLTSIEIPNSVTSIGNYAFENCSSLTSIIIPTGVTSIGNSTFSGCTSLNNIQIPNSVASIGSLAFQSCRSLTTIEIPASVTSIGNNAFSGCTSLNTINYHGTEEEFNAITIGSGNGYFTKATVNYIED